MFELKQTETFRTWRIRLKDEGVRARIASRLDRLAFGNAGDVKPVGDGISELRIDYGPGYRIYFKKRGKMIHPPAVWWNEEHTDKGHSGGEAVVRRREPREWLRN